MDEVGGWQGILLVPTRGWGGQGPWEGRGGTPPPFIAPEGDSHGKREGTVKRESVHMPHTEPAGSQASAVVAVGF